MARHVPVEIRRRGSRIITSLLASGVKLEQILARSSKFEAADIS